VATDSAAVLQRKFDKDSVANDTNISRVALFIVGRLSSGPITLLMLKMSPRFRGHRIGELAIGKTAENIAN
jgi:hypothetical protein